MCHFNKFLCVGTLMNAGNTEMNKALGMTSRKLWWKGGRSDMNIGEYKSYFLHAATAYTIWWLQQEGKIMYLRRHWQVVTIHTVYSLKHGSAAKYISKKPTDLQYILHMIYSKFYFPNREFINMTQNSKYAPIFLRYLASLMTATIFTQLVLVDPSRRWLCPYVYEHMYIHFFFPYVGTWHFSLKMDPKNHSLPVLNLMTFKNDCILFHCMRYYIIYLVCSLMNIFLL